MECLTIFAILAGPTVGVLIAIWTNMIKEKNLQRMNLFLRLLTSRKSYPFPNDFVDALNLIDVVYHKHNKVINAWKNLYKSFHVKPYEPTEMQKKLLDLLDEMAKSLGYKNIKQTDYDSFYVPKSDTEQKALRILINTELLRVLQSSQSFGTSKPPNQNNQKQP